MRQFLRQKDVFEYIRFKFRKGNTLLLVRGSTARKTAKHFSDFDIEVYGRKVKKPYYEIALLKEKVILISVYFYVYQEGSKVQTPLNVKILHGEYNDIIKPDFRKDSYTQKEKIQRECQLMIDFFFKYLRTKNRKYLRSIQRRI